MSIRENKKELRRWYGVVTEMLWRWSIENWVKFGENQEKSGIQKESKIVICLSK